MDSSLNMENMPLASTAIRTCFWGRVRSWLDRNRELSRSVHFPSLTLPSLLITSSKMIWISLVLSLLSNYFLEQELTWARFQIPCLWMCVSSGRRKQKVICNLALEGEQLSRERDCFCYYCLALNPCLFIVIVLSHYWCPIHFLIASVKGNLAKVTAARAPNQ